MLSNFFFDTVERGCSLAFMAEYTAYPLSWPIGWPRNKSTVRSRFGTWRNKPSVARSRDVVIAELKRAGVADWKVVISTNLPLRRDGLPYSNQKEPDDTGAAVYWKDRKGKQLVLACDKYDTVGDNLYAIGKTIEATRGIERWGSVTVRPVGRFWDYTNRFSSSRK